MAGQPKLNGFHMHKYLKFHALTTISQAVKFAVLDKGGHLNNSVVHMHD